MPKSIKSILVADYDIQLVSFLQERIRDRRIQFVLATHFDHIVDLLENETFFAAIVDFEFRNEKGAKVIDYVIAKTIPAIATINELTPECHKEILQYPVIDYVIKNNLAGKGYLADLLYGLEYFYNKKVLICYGNREPHITEELVSLFRSLLFRPIVAKSVTEALERLEHDESINIVYVDEDLNGEDGLGLCREIKYRFGRRDMILFGGADSLGHLFDFEKTKGEFLKSGVTDFFTRPIDKERFNTHILSMMKILKQKRRLDTYVETVDKYVLISITNLQGVIVYASDAFCDISGYSKDELIGKNHNIVRHPDMPNSIYEDLWQTIKSGKPWTGEIKNRKKNGDFYWVSITIEPIYDDNSVLMGYQSIRFDITDKKRVEELSVTDRLTGMFNRRKFEELLGYELAQHDRYGKELAVVMVDIDHFKEVNDTYGHPVGDKVLFEVAKLLSSCVRGSDSVCRWGGEEFVIISPHTDLKGALELGDKIRSRIASFTFHPTGHQTVSVGVTTVLPEDTEDLIVMRADAALYQAKTKGRNRVEAL